MPLKCSGCGAVVISTDNGGEASTLNLVTDPQTLARLGELSATNEAPQATELSIIRPIVEGTSARLESLDAEIFRLQARLRQIEQERTMVSQYHDKTVWILSPLRRTPPELGEIFSWTLPSICDSVKNCPWVLTHVCRGWRSAALCKPSLWSQIHLDFSVRERYSMEMVTAQIERARSLQIHFLGAQACDSAPQIAMFKLLSRHSARCCLQLTSHLVPHVTLHRNLTGLRRAWVQWDGSESQTLDSVDFLQRAISLVDIGVHSEYRFLPTRPTRLPVLHHLTRYDFDAPWSTHRHLLESIPTLQEARIRLRFDDDEDWPEPGEHIDVPNLRRLYVTHPTPLEYLKAPGLEEIAIWGSEEDETCHYLERFLIRSACSPRCLGIRPLSVARAVAALLPKYPFFTEITVIHDDDDELETLPAFLSCFAIPNPSASTLALPHFAKIRFACRTGDGIIFPLFLHVLESRRNAREYGVKPIQCLLLTSGESPDPRSVARIEKMRQAGFFLFGDEVEDISGRWFSKLIGFEMSVVCFLLCLS
ncbi:hypothetical protein C8R45DRAFT_899871 [Mycena sanguinolenta]|nr:hypothetical protein C8R45DRAFT_899871 [Mycena sanguinolenta]